MGPEKGYIYEIFCSFQGEGPRVGERHVFLRLCCCSLGCAYCDTEDAQDKRPAARIRAGAGGAWTTQENPVPAHTAALAVTDVLQGSAGVSALCVTGGEPLEQPGFVAAVLDELGGGTRVILETNGTLPGAFGEVERSVDVVSMDIKLPSTSGLGPLWDGHAAFIGACRKKELVAKAVVSPDTPAAEVAEAARLVAAAPGSLFVLQPLSPKAGACGRAFSEEKLSELYDAAAAHGAVRVIPQVHKFLGVR